MTATASGRLGRAGRRRGAREPVTAAPPLDLRLPRTAPAVRRLLVMLVALNTVGVVLVIATATLLAEIVATVIQGSVPSVALVWLGVVGALRAGVAGAQEWVTSRDSVLARAQLRRAVLSAVTRLGPDWSARQPAGRLVTACGPGLESLDGYLTRAVPALVSAVLVPPVVLVRIGLADWQSALVLLVCLPLVPLFMVLLGVTTRRRMQQQYATLGRLAGRFLDLVQGLTTLKVYGQARRQVDTVRSVTEDYRRKTLATLRTAFLSGLVMDLIATLAVAVVAVDIGLRLDHGSLDLRTALLVLLLAPELFAPLRAVGAQYHAAEEGRVAAADALAIVDTAPQDVPDHAASWCEVHPRATLRITDLRVTYPDRDAPGLAGASLSVAPGEVIAVEGPSGAGKSTLLAVLLRFLAASGGRINVGVGSRCMDLADIDPARWRAGIAWVPQRPTPTQESVGVEAALGDPAASLVQIDAALAACRAPAADTPLGQDGELVSAGQRRRVALARALLRAQAVRRRGELPLVLLDEPSEDLDGETEQVVASIVGSLAGWASVLIVTHRPALAAVADRRVLLVDGRIVDDAVQQPVRPVLPVQTIGHTDEAVPTPGKQAAQMTVPTAECPFRQSLRQLFGGVVRSARGLVTPALLSGAAGLAGLALTATSLWLICRAAQHPNVQALALAVVGVRTFALSRALLRYGERLAGHDAALRLLADLRARVFAALEPLAPAGLREFRRGDLLRRFVVDVDSAQEGLVRAVLPLAGATITCLGAAALALMLAPAAGAALALGLGLGLLVIPTLTRLGSGSADELAALAGRRDQRSAAMLTGIGELTAYGALEQRLAEIVDDDRRVIAAGRRAAMSATLGATSGGLVTALTVPAVLGLGAIAATADRLDPIMIGVLLACALAGFDALAPLPAAFAAWSRFRAGLDRVAAVLATPAPVREPHTPAAPPPSDDLIGVRTDAARLAPAPDAPAVVDGLDLAVQAGRRIALVGPSGCGKTTVLRAALRLLPTQAGSIAVTSTDGDVDLADLSAAAVPPVLAGSLQGDHVFDATLRDNLRVVRPDATDSDLDIVAARAGLGEFVAGLPRGWSTPSGADGAALSGGQRQRLLLARALLADPAVLVLDEPTAHLDAATERAVLRDLLDGTRGHTLLLSTHRPLPAGAVDAVYTLGDVPTEHHAAVGSVEVAVE